MPKYKPELIVITCLIIFSLSLFLDNEKVRLTVQLASNAITGYFGFISALNDEEN